MRFEEIKDKKEARKYSEKAYLVWEKQPPNGLLLSYRMPPPPELHEELEKLKVEKRLFDFFIKPDAEHYDIGYEIGNGENSEFIFEVAKLIDSYY